MRVPSEPVLLAALTTVSTFRLVTAAARRNTSPGALSSGHVQFGVPVSSSPPASCEWHSGCATWLRRYRRPKAVRLQAPRRGSSRVDHGLGARRQVPADDPRQGPQRLRRSAAAPASWL